MKSISVIIPTRFQPHLLRRAIASVENQDYTGPIEVVVVTSNNNTNALRALEEIAGVAKVQCKLCFLNLDDETEADKRLLKIYTWARVARQRNLGVVAAQGEFIAHLDEDNEYLPQHLSSLVDVLECSPQLPAAYSWRRLLWEDGSSYTEALYPWIKQPNHALAHYIYNNLVDKGVFQIGSCEVQDQYLSPEGEQLLTVDSSEWLIRRAFHLQFAFREKWQFREVSHALGDNYLFCKQLADSGIHVGCSRNYTLNYYLGGETTKWLLRKQ